MLDINCRAFKLKLYCKLIKVPGGSEQCIEILKLSRCSVPDEFFDKRDKGYSEHGG